MNQNKNNGQPFENSSVGSSGKAASVVIIGAGPAGIEAASQLAQNGVRVTLLEKDKELGGNVKNWVKLFPDFTDASDIRKGLFSKLESKGIDVKTGVSVNKLYAEGGKWIARNGSDAKYSADAVLLATGFEPFDAGRKEELGYGIYDNIITSVEFEKMTKDGKILTADGKVPERIAFLNCVGSRDEKVGNNYCSRVCCINAVKQAVEYKELVPDGDVYVFYMDLRMSGQCYEELYRKSQQDFDVNFIRGRISEAAGTIDSRVQIKSEDTLTGLPLKITVDMLVLMVGMEPSPTTKKLSSQNNIEGEYGFAKAFGSFLNDNKTDKAGLFLAGTCKRPLTIPETIADARAAAGEIVEYVRGK
ncbi:CoB--CoM heterodisulfide reductase iron-sulfur subunit A family protein [Paludibacter sp. 221]|uniref:FAD-dependent oxidoreductase n=1 Tax=Paludibacter sp. 221 TaxID=2302939 RepID=UPI0013D0632F|nr:FAD-dependent oxidoreductase [Paludibacter sp. 221]NDV46913.1 CoB--CoM heterodisulfide reductase iron-sulfur subunit A family protein [Paludibacter sp. 221]